MGETETLAETHRSRNAEIKIAWKLVMGKEEKRGDRDRLIKKFRGD